jgi:hypothetical protein
LWRKVVKSGVVAQISEWVGVSVEYVITKH